MTIEWAKYDLASLTGIYSVSNTPGFLFEEFARDATFQAISAGHTNKQLADELVRLLQLIELPLKDIVCAYICLVALSMAEPPVARSLAERGALFSLRWGLAIVAIGATRHVSTSFRQVTEYQTPNDPKAPKIITSTSTSSYNLDKQWRAIKDWNASIKR